MHLTNKSFVPFSDIVKKKRNKFGNYSVPRGFTRVVVKSGDDEK